MKSDSISSKKECMKLPGTILKRMVSRMQLMMKSNMFRKKKTRPML